MFKVLTPPNIKIYENRSLYEEKMKREIKIMQTVSGGPNIAELIDIIIEPREQKTTLVIEYVDTRGTYFGNFMGESDPAGAFTADDIRHYMYELLRALDYAHSKGVMHRDIKMANVMIDPKLKKLRIIDWGLSEFYFPMKEYSVSVSSREMKGPEILLG